MIIIDTKQMVYHAVTKLTRDYPGLPVQVKSVRAIIVGLVCEYQHIFSETFGDVVLAVDSASKPWRFGINPNYRWRRRKNANKRADLNMEAVRASYLTIMKEMDKYLPLAVLDVPHAEADDVIGALILRNLGPKHLVVSIDHDFEQLLAYENVTLFRPLSYDPSDILDGTLYNSPKSFNSRRLDYKTITPEQAEIIRLTHVIKGDSGDDICNILSPSTSYVDGIRNKTINKAKLLDLMEQSRNKTFTSEDVALRFIENLVMVDMKYIPKEYVQSILDAFEASKTKSYLGFRDYIKDFKLQRFSHIEDIFD